MTFFACAARVAFACAAAAPARNHQSGVSPIRMMDRRHIDRRGAGRRGNAGGGDDERNQDNEAAAVHCFTPTDESAEYGKSHDRFATGGEPRSIALTRRARTPHRRGGAGGKAQAVWASARRLR